MQQKSRNISYTIREWMQEKRESREVKAGVKGEKAERQPDVMVFFIVGKTLI